MVETKRRITVKNTSIKINADFKLKQIWKTTLGGPEVVTVFLIHFVVIKLV